MAKEQKKGLGKGLGALFGGDLPLNDLTHPSKEMPMAREASPEMTTPASDNQLKQLPVDEIHENPWQPRKSFDEDALLDLTESIREKGVLSPLLVAKRDGVYYLVAGERRLRAAKNAGLSEVPVIERDLDEEEMAQIALIENIQRADLNVVEEANGYAALIDKYHYTQQQLADLMGKSRPYIANLLRLRDLPEPVMDALRSGKISAGHARALLAVKDPALQAGLCSDVVSQDLSVRALERMIQDINDFGDALDKKTAPAAKKPANSQYRALCDQLGERLQTKVSVGGSKKHGKLVIDFYGDEDLTRILDALGIETY
ncbi:MAG: ParB/RepB/Spo0J family partition protein [Peptococcaceae bacterium]|nr:ParB/RepB/Spo0J family partition protein [Peptococcaceae bacterium]